MKELVILNNLSNKMNEVKNLGYSPLFIALKGSQIMKWIIKIQILMLSVL